MSTPLPLALLGLVLVSACDPVSSARSQCSARCVGCCDSANICQPGQQALSCGTAGGSCAACAAADVCLAGACTPTVESPGTDRAAQCAQTWCYQPEDAGEGG